MATISDKIKDNNASFYYALLDFKDRHPDVLVRICGVERIGLNDMTHAQILILANEMMIRALDVPKPSADPMLENQPNCKHMYSKAMNEPRPRKCALCGHIEGT